MKAIQMLSLLQAQIVDKLDTLQMAVKTVYETVYNPPTNNLVVHTYDDVDGVVMTVAVGNNAKAGDALVDMAVNITVVTPESHHKFYYIHNLTNGTYQADKGELGIGFRIDLCKAFILALDAALAATVASFPNTPLIIPKV